MKKVILFLDAFGCGGIEKFVVSVCSKINRVRFDISILAVIKDEKTYYDEQLKASGIVIEQLLGYVETNPIKRMHLGHKCFKKYLRQLDKNTILHFNVSNSLDFEYASIARRMGFRNLVMHSHNSDATSNLKRMVHHFFKLFYCHIGSVNMACSKKAAVWLYSKYDIDTGNYVIINNAIDSSQYTYQEDVRSKIRSDLGVSDTFVVGHVGRYNIQKNHDYLIDIFWEIQNIKPDSKLLLIGDGELYEQTASKIKKLGIYDKVIFIKQTSKVNEYLQAMDVFVLPSLYEGLPFVLVEAQAAALPTVASATITHEIAITDYIKYVSLEVGAKEWAKILIQLSGKQRGSTYNQIVESGFDIHKNIHRIEKIYDSLL